MKKIGSLVSRELSVVFRSQSEFIYPVAFFVMVTTMFPLAVSPEPTQLAFIAPGVIWVASLLSLLLSLHAFYQADFDDGSLEQLLLSGVSGYSIVLSKVVANWIVTGLPLVLVAPVIGILLNLDTHANLVAMLALLLGTPSLCFIGAIGMSLTLGLRNGGVLLTLLVLPLFIPILIFGAATVEAASMGRPYIGQVAVLAAALILSGFFAPFAASAAMKISID
ncbi:heme exporter protein CcmB [Aliikangiella marina]|uniref:Heme exporter protein B n=1 Tax=Aliikangiella marina TaxID=1712262 RepID=A0A545T2I6_9GAMM|nr:heme exporter protein CcmB [Aliikangiella marina]TQV71426.1 heme exporter protein CcmB [Aliikangiella marina]